MERTHFFQEDENTKAKILCWMYFQLRFSKSFEKSNFRSMPGVLDVLRECITSWDRMITSIICLPSTQLVFSRDIREGRRGLRQSDMTLLIILKMTLRRVMGRKLLGSFTLSSFRMRERKVEMSVGRMLV
jgi:hypothetical protein